MGVRDRARISKEQVLAIGGLGGICGSYLLTLTRLSFGNFNISDLDRFKLANFNHQAGRVLITLVALR